MGYKQTPEGIRTGISETLVNWDDMRIPVFSTKVGGSKDPDWIKILDDGSGSQGVFSFGFDKSTEEELYFAVQMPHAWKFGTDIEAHVHWTPTVNGAEGEKVVWGLEYSLQDIGKVFGSSIIATGNQTVPGDTALIANKHYLTEIVEVDMSAIETVSAMLICRVFRDATNANDTYGQDAALIEIDFHYQIDGLGSQLEYQKRR